MLLESIPLAEPVATTPRRQPGRLAQRRTVIGIDIGSHSTKIVQVRPDRRSFTVVNFWVLPNSPGSSLTELVQTYRLARRRSVSALGIQEALTRIVRLPRMTTAEVGNALRLEADTYIPMPLDTAAVDFVPATNGGRQGRDMEVLVVAAPREAVEGLAGTLTQAGLQVAAVELEPLAAYRSLRALGLIPPADAGLTAILDLGESASRISVFRQGLPVANRAVKPGGREFTEAITQNLKLTVERAEAAKRHWGVRPGTPVAPLVDGLVGSLLTEVWLSLESFLVLAKAQRLDRVFLIGGNALQPGLADRIDAFLAQRLSERFGQTPSERGLVRLVLDGARVRLLRHLRGVAGEIDARMVTALGLALWNGSP